MKLYALLLGSVLILSSASFAFESSDSSGTEEFSITSIQIIGNKKTKSWVIERELDFKIGDSLSRFELNNALNVSKDNLTNTSLFNFVELKFIELVNQQVEIYVILTERWYFWPIPVFELAETNFNSWWENKDFSRINYGIDFTQYNFRGRNETLKILVQLGFTELVSLSFSTPYFNKKKTIGFTLSGGYGQNHEINYLSENNRRLFYKDVSNVQQRHVVGGIAFRYRQKFYSRHSLGLTYTSVGISDTVVELNPDYLLNANREQEYFSLQYKYILDKRDNKNYALQGHYLRAHLSKFGLGLTGSDVDLWWSGLELKKYWHLHKRFYFAAHSRIQFYLNELQPYYLRDGLGYYDKTTVRSYELYVMDAQQLAIGKLQLRYQIAAPKKYNLEFIPINKFKQIHYSIYLGLFGDIGYARDEYNYPQNDLANDLQYGSGISLDFATYYDLVMRIEYSMNKFAEHGLFLHFVAPI